MSDVFRVDLADRLVDYASNEGNPLDQQLWQVNFNGERKQLSSWQRERTAATSRRRAAHLSTGNRRAWSRRRSELCAEAGKCNVFWTTRALEPYHLRAPEQLEVKAHDGTTLYATLLLPEAQGSGELPCPLIVNPYGGPGSPSVANRWGDSLLFDELLAQHGFAVLHTDNRGIGRPRARTLRRRPIITSARCSWKIS